MLACADRSLSVPLVSARMAHAPHRLVTGQPAEASKRVPAVVSASKALAPLASAARILLAH
jgi:hypothetical protein